MRSYHIDRLDITLILKIQKYTAHTGFVEVMEAATGMMLIKRDVKENAKGIS